MGRPLWLLAFGAALLALALALLGLVSRRDRRRLGGIGHFLASTILVLAAALAIAVGVGMRGYSALTREVRAATVEVRALGNQRYEAVVRFRDGGSQTFTLRGDALYVDAHILKWTPAANLLGLHTSYRLDRIAGRYDSIDDEQTQPRTVYALHDPAAVDLFAFAQRYRFLAPILDATYGSGTFVPLGAGGTFEIEVSTTGLLARQTSTAPAPPAPPSR